MFSPFAPAAPFKYGQGAKRKTGMGRKLKETHSSLPPRPYPAESIDSLFQAGLLACRHPWLLLPSRFLQTSGVSNNLVRPTVAGAASELMTFIAPNFPFHPQVYNLQAPKTW